jgi:hypothetical protein
MTVWSVGILHFSVFSLLQFSRIFPPYIKVFHCIDTTLLISVSFCSEWGSKNVEADISDITLASYSQRPVSNFDTEASYSYPGLSWFSSLPPGKCQGWRTYGTRKQSGKGAQSGTREDFHGTLQSLLLHIYIYLFIYERVVILRLSSPSNDVATERFLYKPEAMRIYCLPNQAAINYFDLSFCNNFTIKYIILIIIDCY